MKKLLIILLLPLFMFNCFAFEWGGLFKENAKATVGNLEDIIMFDTMAIRQSNSLALWMTTPFDESSNWYISGQMSYKYNLDFTVLGRTFTNIVDVDLLKVAGVIPVGVNNITLSAGRFFVADSTAKIFCQNTDGFLIKYSSLFMNISMYAGYTGLLNGYTVTMLNSAGFEDSDNKVFLKVYKKSRSYVPVTASITFPSLFLNQAVGLQAMAFFDVNKENDALLYIKANRYYGTLFMEGPIYGPVFYSMNTTFGSLDFKNVMNMSMLEVSVFSKFVSTKFRVEYASGKHACFEPFVGFTSYTAYNSPAYPQYSGLLMPSADLIFTFKNISVYLNGKYVLSAMTDKIESEGIDASLRTYINIFSDLQLEVGAGLYYDIHNSGSDNFYNANIGLSLAF